MNFGGMHSVHSREKGEGVVTHGNVRTSRDCLFFFFLKMGDIKEWLIPECLAGLLWEQGLLLQGNAMGRDWGVR